MTRRAANLERRPTASAGVPPVAASHAALAYSTGSQSFPGSFAVTPAQYGATAYDTDGYWDVGHPSRLTVPEGLGGLYVIQMRVAIAWSGSDTETDSVFLLNGSRTTGIGTYSVGLSTSAYGQGLPFGVEWFLDEGDYVEMGVAHGAGSSRTSPAGDCWLALSTFGVGTVFDQGFVDTIDGGAP